MSDHKNDAGEGIEEGISAVQLNRLNQFSLGLRRSL